MIKMRIVTVHTPTNKKIFKIECKFSNGQKHNWSFFGVIISETLEITMF